MWFIEDGRWLHPRVQHFSIGVRSCHCLMAMLLSSVALTIPVILLMVCQVLGRRELRCRNTSTTSSEVVILLSPFSSRYHYCITPPAFARVSRLSTTRVSPLIARPLLLLPPCCCLKLISSVQFPSDRQKPRGARGQRAEGGSCKAAVNKDAVIQSQDAESGRQRHQSSVPLVPTSAWRRRTRPAAASFHARTDRVGCS